jgi:hypothetical protein
MLLIQLEGSGGEFYGCKCRRGVEVLCVVRLGPRHDVAVPAKRSYSSQYGETIRVYPGFLVVSLPCGGGDVGLLINFQD